jgi:hypothetical protein
LAIPTPRLRHSLPTEINNSKGWNEPESKATQVTVIPANSRRVFSLLSAPDR